MWGRVTASRQDHRSRGAGSLDSLFRCEISLFACVGNSFPTAWIHSGISARSASARAGIGEIPCIFPAYQGIAFRDEFASDSTHRHSVCSCRDDCAPGIAIRGIRADSQRAWRWWCEAPIARRLARTPARSPWVAMSRTARRPETGRSSGVRANFVQSRAI